MALFPPDHRMEAGASRYLKLKPGDNRFRPLAPPIIGKLLWIDAGGGKRKPVRRKYGTLMSDLVPAINKYGQPERTRDFVAMTCWDYTDSTIKVLELTQATVLMALDGLTKDPDWSDPWDLNGGYALNIQKTGTDRDTAYNLVPSPKRPADPAMLKALAEAPIRLEALYDGGDPFGVAQPAQTHPGASTGRETAPPPAGWGEVGTDPTEEYVSGLIFDIKKAKASNGRTRYGLVMETGETIGTFSDTLGKTAERFMASRTPVTAGFTNDGKFLTLTTLAPTPAVAATVDDGSDIPF